jgi:hypothetical protein
MWYIQDTTGNIQGQANDIREVFEAFLKSHKNTLSQLNGTELSVQFLKTSMKKLRYMKSIYVNVDNNDKFNYDWVFTRLEQDLIKEPNEIWVLDFMNFGLITNSPESQALHRWNDWWNRCNL